MNSVGSVKTVTLLGSVTTPMEWWRETPISGIDSCRQGSPCHWRWCPRAYAHCAQLGQQSSRRDAADPLYVLWRLARDHIFRPRSARDGRWREDRKIGAAAHEAIEADLAIPYGCKLTAQETWWRTMLGGRPDGVNNTDARARLERGDKIEIGLTISATGRSGFGNATAGTPASAMNSCAEPDTVSAAAKTAAIVIRITSPASSCVTSIYLAISDMILQHRERSDAPIHQGPHYTTTLDGVCQRRARSHVVALAIGLASLW